MKMRGLAFQLLSMSHSFGHDTTDLVAPPDLVLADDGLHNGVEAALRRVQVARHLSALHLSLSEDRVTQR